MNNQEDPLRSLLHEWEAPPPPVGLETRVRARFRAWRRPTWFGRLWSFRISIPAPLLAAALLLLAVGFWLVRRTAPLQPPAIASPAGEYMTRLETAGFQPLPDGEVRIIRSGAKK